MTEQTTMKAALCESYGSVEALRLGDVPRPTLLRDGVLIRVLCSTVSSADWRLRTLSVPLGFRTIAPLAVGLRRPRQPIFGSELSGIVEAVGQDVRAFEPGNAVVAFPGIALGAHAEYCQLREAGNVLHRPSGLTDEEAASLFFGATTALYFLRDKGRLQRGQKVLVIGGSGAVGSAAVQLARHYGAEVSAVTSTANLTLVEQLGAHHPIDYTRSDFTREDARYDIILDTIGVSSFVKARPALRPAGRFLMVAAGLPAMLRAIVTLPRRQKAIAGMAPERRPDLELLAELAAVKVWRPLIDSIHSMADIKEAHRRVESGRKRGNVVLRISGGPRGAAHAC